ncbi:MAG: sodium-dependent transporter [Bacteroidales bacterium]|nr:sodium-dependent transporter [Bacteroidales bacterium]
MENRGNFATKLGIIAAVAGSAVGLGNIWRFPYLLGQNGGAAFFLVYLLCVVLMGIPVMMAEMSLGRMGRRNASGAFKALGRPKWSLLGKMGVLCAFLILGFYYVVAGWTLEYTFQAIKFDFIGQTPGDLADSFAAFSTHNIRPIVTAVAFMIITCLVVSFGVKKGIENSSRMLMPILFIFIIVLAIRSVTLPGAMEGLKFLFKPDFGKITADVVLSAMGQAFFSLSIGMGCLLTYGSYVKKDVNLENTSLQVVGVDTLVAVLAAIAIFPAVFSMGLDPGQGPQLVFVTLPHVFNQMPGGSIFAIIFFLLLVVTTLTSTISLLEVVTAYFGEEFNMKRGKASVLASALCVPLVVLASLSLGQLGHIQLFHCNIFDFLDKITSQIFMPLGGLLICIFVGWILPGKDLHESLSNKGKIKLRIWSVFYFLVRYVSPVVILLIFLGQFLR